MVVEEISMVFHTKLLQSSHNFWKTISWKCSLEDNCNRVLYNVNSFFNCKVNINPNYRVLMFLPCTVRVSRSAWCRGVDVFRIFMICVSWIGGREGCCLSWPQILTSRYQSIIDHRMKIECTSYVVNVMENPTPNVGSMRLCPERP